MNFMEVCEQSFIDMVSPDMISSRASCK